MRSSSPVRTWCRPRWPRASRQGAEMAFRMTASRLRRLLSSLSALEPGALRSPWYEVSGFAAPCVPKHNKLCYVSQKWGACCHFCPRWN